MRFLYPLPPNLSSSVVGLSVYCFSVAGGGGDGQGKERIRTVEHKGVRDTVLPLSIPQKQAPLLLFAREVGGGRAGRAQETKGESEAPCRTHAFPSDSLSLSTRGITFLVCPPLPPFSRLPFDASAGKNNNPLLGPPPAPPAPVAPKRRENFPHSPQRQWGRAVQKLPTATREANCPPAPSPWKRRDTSRRTKWISSLSLLFREEKGGCSAEEEEKRRLF